MDQTMFNFEDFEIMHPNDILALEAPIVRSDNGYLNDNRWMLEESHEFAKSHDIQNSAQENFMISSLEKYNRIYSESSTKDFGTFADYFEVNSKMVCNQNEKYILL